MKLLLAVMLFATTGDIWPGFLGSGAKISGESKLPLTWSPTENIAWNVPIPGHGQSSPVIWDQRVFVTSVDEPLKDSCLVFCYDLSSGKELWKYSLPTSDPVENSVYVSRAAPTPVVDAERVIVFFESGDLVALDHAGKEIWKRSLSKEFGKFQNKFGLSGSPVQTDKDVIILIDDEGPSYLVALDKATGNVTWKKDRTSRTSWSSPGIISVDGVQQVVASSAGSVDGYDAASGELLWSMTDVGGNTGTTPIDLGNGHFLVAASAGQDGKNSEMAKKSNFMMRVQRDGQEWTASKVWLTEEATPSWASPIAHKGCAYWVNRVGVVYCLDSETGKLHYKERTKQSCWATPFAMGDRVYFFGKEGITSVLAAGPEFKVLSENVLWDPDSIKPDENAGAKEPTEERRRAAAMFSGPTVYGVAIANESLVIRLGDRLFCVRETR
jgi:outer membrane protein assembly factor BamB